MLARQVRHPDGEALEELLRDPEDRERFLRRSFRRPHSDFFFRRSRSVLDAVDTATYDVVPVGITRDGLWRTGAADADLADIVAAGEVVPDLRALSPALVFPVLHGPNGARVSDRSAWRDRALWFTVICFGQRGPGS